MKSKSPFVWLLIAIAVPLIVVFAANRLCKNCDDAALRTAKSIGEAKVLGLNAVQTDLKVVRDRINFKLAPVDEATEALLADEIAALDAVVAKYKAQPSDDVAEVLLTKASIYQRFLDNPDKAIEVFRQIKTDFPQTKHAARTDELIARAEARKVKMAIRDSLKPGVAFPAFAVTDIDGKPLALEQYRGKILLVDFWATWCPPCRADMPHVVAAYQKYHDKGFDVVGFSLDKTKEPLVAYIKANKMSWRQYCDEKWWDSDMAEKYGILSIPSTFLLDGEGRIIAKNLRGGALAAELEKLLGK